MHYTIRIRNDTPNSMNRYMKPHCSYPDTISVSIIFEDAMQLVWNHTPTNFQREVIPRLLMMRYAPNKPEVIMIIKGTGPEKSEVVQTVGCMYCNVTIVIEKPSLLLWNSVPRQHKKINVYERVLMSQLDYTKKIDRKNKLCSRLSYLKRGINIKICMYTSPKYIVRDLWFDLVTTFISNEVLNLVCVDKFQFLGSFGITFRKEVVFMKKSFFCHLIDDISRYHQTPLDLVYTLKVSLLLMAVVFDHKLLHLIKKIRIGVKSDNFIWIS